MQVVNYSLIHQNGAVKTGDKRLTLRNVKKPY